MVHGIVQQYHGWVDVASQPGKGSAFSIFFPRIEAQPVARVSAEPYCPTGSETILLVDDDAQLVEMTGEMLASLGYRVFPAVSPVEALQRFTEIPDTFDLVFTDQTMPGMTGDALVRRLREIRPELPAIICTGFSETMDAHKARAAGIDGFLMKPIEMADLARMARRVIDERHLPLTD